MKNLVLLSAFFFLGAPVAAQAEYRVFLLKISKQDPAVTDHRLVESTLDPTQYREYNPLLPDDVVTYIETWRCYGRTDNFKPHCPNPKGQISPEENPAS